MSVITRRVLRHIILLPLLFLPATVLAATITVDVNTDGSGAANVCELRDAILAANTDAQVDGCLAGNGADLITFSIMATITLTAELPAITNSLEIAGPGQEKLQISGGELYRIFTIASGGAFVTFRDLSLVNGFNSLFAGCIFLNVNTPFVTLFEDVTIQSCAVGGLSGGGGAMYAFAPASGSSMTFRRVTIAKNSTGGSGGGISLDTDIALIESSTFYGNTSSNGPGGALAISGGTQLTVNRSTFWANEAYSLGSAIFSQGVTDTIDIFSSTVASNTTTGTAIVASHPGGAIFVQGPLSLANTAVANNFEQNPNHSVTDLNGGVDSQITTLGYNFIGNNEGSAATFPAGVNANGDRAGTAIAMLNANLTSLQENGGPTLTAAPHMINSTLLDQGSCSLETRDQRGFGNPDTGLRIVDDPRLNNADDGCDIGAVEILAERLDPVVIFEDGFEYFP